MKTLTKDMRIFSYRTEPLHGIEGDDGGFSIEIYGNGNLRYCTYQLFDNIRKMQMYKLDKETVYGIYEKMEDMRLQLLALPDQLDNGSKDGMMQQFQFGEICWVTATNIQEMSLQKAAVLRYHYYKQYRDNIKNENVVMKVFQDISRILYAAGVELKLGSCDIWRDCRLTVTW